MIRVLVVGQTPPPIGGQAIMIRSLLGGPLPDMKLYHVRMGFSESMQDMGKARLRKVFQLVAVILRIYYHRLVRGTRILYYPPAGPERFAVLRDLAILLSTRWMFAKTVFHFHAGGVSDLYPRLPRVLQPFFRLAYYYADAGIRTSELAPDDPANLHARRQYVIPNGIYDRAAEIELPRSNPSGERELRVLFVGVLRESKGLFLFLEACGRLWHRGLRVQAELMGEFQSKDTEARTKQLISDWGIGAYVSHLGVLGGQDKLACFSRADVVCLPTFFESETFGLVFVEAMCFGKPVVATRWRGIPSVVDDGRTGFLVEPHDVMAVVDRLARLAQDPALRRKMGEAGRRKFTREYRIETFLSRMQTVFTEVANDQPTAVNSDKESLALASRGGSTESPSRTAIR